MAYRQVYFRIRTDCYNSGWTSDADRTAFEKESRRLFQELGWTATLARYIAKNIVAAGLAEKCTVSLAYAIGRAEPVAVDIDAHQTGKYSEAVLEQAVRAVFDLTPSGMISALELDRPIFAQFCNYGHFTHQDAPWEQTDRAAALADACQMAGAGAFTR